MHLLGGPAGYGMNMDRVGQLVMISIRLDVASGHSIGYGKMMKNGEKWSLDVHRIGDLRIHSNW